MKKINVILVVFVLFSGLVSAQMPTTTTTTLIPARFSTVKFMAEKSTTLSNTTHATIIVRPGKKLQSAIDAAKPGDTILVKAGVYKEAIIVNKPLTIRGEDARTTIIRGVCANATNNASNCDCVVVSSSNVKFSGFTLTNCYTGAFVGASSNVVFSQLKIKDAATGIIAIDANNIVIENNAVEDVIYGMTCEFVDKSSISNNRINDAIFGLWLFASNNNSVSKNMVDTNRYAYGIQLSAGSSGNKVAANILTDNYWGLLMDSNSSNRISRNVACKNSPWDILAVSSTGNYYDKNFCDASNPVGLCEFRCPKCS
jgi:parallel beta-helix repeat protein